MSRSYRHTPMHGVCADSDKRAKRFARKGWRRRLHQAPADEAVALPLLREVSDVWDMPKDGKSYFGDYEDFSPGWMRK